MSTKETTKEALLALWRQCRKTGIYRHYNVREMRSLNRHLAAGYKMATQHHGGNTIIIKANQNRYEETFVFAKHTPWIEL